MIDSDTQQLLRAKYNPDGSPLRTLQLKQLEVLKYADRICKENNIPYWLSSGTCLGAVRHGGFIPWDDDVDIEMMSEDYRRFRKAVKRDGDPRFVLQDTSSDRNFFFQFGKLRLRDSSIVEKNGTDVHFRYRGVFIDVFRMEPSGSLMAHRASHRPINTFIKTNDLRPEFLRKAVLEVLRFFFDGLFAPALRLASRIGAGDQLRHRILSPFHVPRRKSEIFPLKEMEFEGIMLPVPGNTHAYLSRMFGDYNRLPADKSGKHFS
ncbi:MAG: LicD family protein [Muribaculum sp.]|nr:LicD family protein [Muribaculum sp.]